MPTPLAMFSPGPMEMIIIGIVAVLLFGKRLPEVGRSLGRGLVEFKKGVRGIEDDMDDDASDSDRVDPSFTVGQFDYDGAESTADPEY